MHQNVSISNKCCYFNIYYHPGIFYHRNVLEKKVIIRMISDRSCDTTWRYYAKNSALPVKSILKYIQIENIYIFVYTALYILKTHCLMYSEQCFTAIQVMASEYRSISLSLWTQSTRNGRIDTKRG